MEELKKETKTINVYFHLMKALADSLTSIWMPLRDEDFILYILASLADNYHSLFEVITSYTTPMLICDLFS
jgi:hypothetical protein